MGCDIHLYVEKLQDGRWVTADRWEADGDGDKSVKYENRFYSGRNYELFAILADVRNHHEFKPIADPRGIPPDASQEVLAESDAWDVDGHSHSWFTVRELLEYDWTQVTELQGWVDAKTFEQYDRLKQYGDTPAEYCGGVGGVRKVTNEEMARMLKAGEDTDRAYTLLKWPQTYSSVAAHFLSTTMPKLWRLGSPDSVRIVFWFDN